MLVKGSKVLSESKIYVSVGYTVVDTVKLRTITILFS
jgi:hypothetical protein